MKGLLRKEFYALKNTFGILAVFMLVYAAIGYVGNNASMLVAMAAMIVMMQPANSISYDELLSLGPLCVNHAGIAQDGGTE